MIGFVVDCNIFMNLERSVRSVVVMPPSAEDAESVDGLRYPCSCVVEAIVSELGALVNIVLRRGFFERNQFQNLSVLKPQPSPIRTSSLPAKELERIILARAFQYDDRSSSL